MNTEILESQARWLASRLGLTLDRAKLIAGIAWPIRDGERPDCGRAS